MTKAGNLDVAAEGTNNAGSVSLGKIGQTTSFNVTLTNYGQTTQSYTVDYDGGPLTQVRDTSNGNIVHDQKLAGAAVNTATPTFTLAPGASKVVTFTLALADAVAANQIVEGYLTFKAGTTPRPSVCRTSATLVTSPPSRLLMIRRTSRTQSLRVGTSLITTITRWGHRRCLTEQPRE